jgi:pimeloyl-ACP methyl ester carboxylesterase
MTLERCTIGGGLPARCGTLTVPENPAGRGGRQIEIFVAVKPATSEPVEPDPVFFLAGGPGAAASEAWASSGIFPGLNDHRDIVLMDQRGTGRSHKLVIPPPPGMAGLTDEQQPAALTAYYAYAVAHLDGNVRYYTTAIAMDDLDKVRQALGYERINLYGGSYGGTALQYYLRQHGEHVRSAVLDGATFVDIPLFERLAPNAQRALDLTFARCEADATCHQAFPDVRSELASLMDRARRGDLDLLDESTQQTVHMTPVTVQAAIQSATISAESADLLPAVIHQAYSRHSVPGNGGSGVNPGLPAMQAAIRCSEAWARYRPAETARLGAGTLFADWAADGAREWDAICAAMPRGITPPNDGERARSVAPVLILTGEADPQDPPEHVAGAARELPKSLSIVVPGQGHTVGTIGCLPQIVADFFARGTTAGLDTSCVAKMQPPLGGQ